MHTISTGKRPSANRVRALRILLLMVFSFLLTNDALHAIPRFTLLAGTRCSACHYSPQRGGIRREFGWMMMNETGALSLEDVGLGGLHSDNNSYLDGLLTVGLDARAQLTKIGRPPNERRLFFPMQIAAHAAVTPTEGLEIYGGYNFSTLKYKFNGQTSWNAAIQYQPSLTAPSIRVGYIQPSIGIRHDDHTIFTRKEAARNGLAIVPADYNEYGAEATYEGLHWLSVDAGVFATQNLASTEPTVDSGDISYALKVTLWPQLLDEGINGMIGASAFRSGDFTMINAFAGIGLADKATIIGEAMYSDNVGDKRLRNVSILGSYQLAEWLALEWRYEWGQTEIPPSDLYHADTFVMGLQFFPIPFLELRPEYRIYENDEFRLAQYTLQIHAFY